MKKKIILPGPLVEPDPAYQANERIYVPAGPTIAAFHNSNAFFRGLMGPFGSGKSSACIVGEILRRAQQQRKAPDGRRYFRAAAIRNTRPDLLNTTIKSWLMWVPEKYGKFTWGSPPKHVIETDELYLEVLFLNLDDDADIKKVLGAELTMAWLNEAREIPKSILDALTGRVMRYPPKFLGGPSWYGIIADTNPPDTEHWWYKMAEGTDPDMDRATIEMEKTLASMGVLKPGQKAFEFFRQPSGLAPEAENLQNLEKGYYQLLSINKSKDWVRVYVEGEYGFVIEGRPVYPMYRDSTHARVVEADDNLPLLIGVDLGLTPAAVIGQRHPNGQWRILDEFVTEDCGLVRFAESLARYIHDKYPEFLVGGGWLDPAGRARDSEERTSQDILKSHTKWNWQYAPTNDFQPRREVVVSVLNRLIDGEPGVLINAGCATLREGFTSKYHFKQVKSSNGAEHHEIPVKNRFSHPHEALQYLLAGGGEHAVVLNKAGRQRREGTVIAEGVGEDVFPAKAPPPVYTSERDLRSWMDKRGKPRQRVARDIDSDA